MDYTDIYGSVQKRASKVTTPRGLYILNHLVKDDIWEGVSKTFYDYFHKEVKITIVSGTVSYALPTDYYATEKIKDESENIILRGSNTPRDVDNKNKVQIYGGNVIIDSDASFTELYISYFIEFPEFEEVGDIDLPDNITKELKNVWVSGLEYFYFSDNKKVQETQTSYARYEDSKSKKFTFSIGTLSR